MGRPMGFEPTTTRTTTEGSTAELRSPHASYIQEEDILIMIKVPIRQVKTKKIGVSFYNCIFYIHSNSINDYKNYS